MEDKRDIERYLLTVPAKVNVMDELHGMRGLKAYTRDVSSRGTFLTTDEKLEVGQKVQLELYLSIEKLNEFFQLDKNVRIEVSGEVVRNQEDGVGIRFDKRYTILPHGGE